MENYDGLYWAIERLKEKEARQYIAVALEGGKILAETNEQELLDKIGQTAVKSILCVWHGGAFDLPSMDFRLELVRRNTENFGAKIILRNAAGALTEKVLSDTVPRKTLFKE